MAARWRKRARRQVQLERQPDDLPKRGLFSEPVRITRLDALDPEPVEGPQADTQPRPGEDPASDVPADSRAAVRVTFLAEVKDAEDRRCSDLAVDARVTGPHRSAVVQATTDLFGRVRIRMAGPPGSYEVEILEVAAKALTFDRDAGPHRAAIEVPADVVAPEN